MLYKYLKTKRAIEITKVFQITISTKLALYITWLLAFLRWVQFSIKRRVSKSQYSLNSPPQQFPCGWCVCKMSDTKLIYFILQRCTTWMRYVKNMASFICSIYTIKIVILKNCMLRFLHYCDGTDSQGNILGWNGDVFHKYF